MAVLTRLGFGVLAGLGALGFVAARRRRHRLVPVIATVTINKPVSEVYAFFHRPDQLPRFMDSLETVEDLGDDFWQWTAKLPGGRTVSWETELVEIVPHEALAWRSQGKVPTRGRVTFRSAPGRDMTEVRVVLELGTLRIASRRTVARLFAKPQLESDLQRLKQVLETGEVLA